MKPALPTTWFHGTSPEGARSIPKDGFRTGLRHTGSPNILSIREATQWYRDYYTKHPLPREEDYPDEAEFYAAQDTWSEALMEAQEGSGLGTPLPDYVYLARDLDGIITRDLTQDDKVYAFELAPDPACMIPDEDWLGYQLRGDPLFPEIAAIRRHLGVPFQKDIQRLDKEYTANRDDWRVSAPVGKDAILRLQKTPLGRKLLAATLPLAETAAVRVTGDCPQPRIVRKWSKGRGVGAAWSYSSVGVGKVETLPVPVYTLRGKPYTLQQLEREVVRVRELGSDRDRVLSQSLAVLNALQFPLLVYRGLHIPRGKTFDAKRAAATTGHWTWNPQVAEHFARGTHENASDSHDPVSPADVPHLLGGVISRASDVDWLHTLDLYLGFSDPKLPPHRTEDEISAVPAAIRVIG